MSEPVVLIEVDPETEATISKEHRCSDNLTSSKSNQVRTVGEQSRFTTTVESVTQQSTDRISESITYT
jgi:hypothetical protein